MAEKPELNPDDILIAEFEYIATTATQANEDRSKVASFYLVSFGSFIAALLTTQLGDGQQYPVELLEWGFAVLFLVLAALGLLTIIQLARLRMAWLESVLAMNQIKEYYISRFEVIKLSRAFRFNDKAMPKPFKVNSVAFVMILEVAILAGFAAGAAVIYLFQATGQQNWSWGWPTAIGFGFSVLQIVLYRLLLK
jgi:hypothetical protein